MSRYRKVDVRMRSDEKFRALSAPPPNGQDCWIHLLTNRFTTSIPGLYAAFEETLARDLGWPLEGYREAFREASSKGMAKADWNVGLVFIPNAIKYDPPQSPNVVKSWGDLLDELPECRLKHEAYEHIKAFVEGMSKGFREAFAESCGKTYRIQEQEQEQEQERGKDTRARTPERVSADGMRAAWVAAGLGSMQDQTAMNLLRLEFNRDGCTADVVAYCAAWKRISSAWRSRGIGAGEGPLLMLRHLDKCALVVSGEWDPAVQQNAPRRGAANKTNWREPMKHVPETKDETDEL